MSTSARPGIFTIPAHAAFVDALAQGLIDRCGGDRLALARAQVLVPNRRAVRALSDAFVRLSDGGLLLPRMIPVGDVDADEALGSFADDGDMAADLAPAIDPVRRRLLLAQMVRRWRDGTGVPINAVEALRLADQLAKAFDTLYREGVEPGALAAAVPGELAAHWQATFAFFQLMLDVWPQLLVAEQATERARRDTVLIAALAARWAASPPPGLVVAAGMAATTPAQAALIGTVARLPQGLVVLPGLDTDMSADMWDAIVVDSDGERSDSHPQFALKQLLERIGVARGEVQPWPVGGHAGSPERSAAVARAMSPAAFTGDWRTQPVDPAWFADVTTIEAPDLETEAQAIALALRRQLETPGATAALVTPDRKLARRVAAHCARWGIAIDDSAGIALRSAPPGALTLALVEAAAQHFAPVALLAVLKHPLVDPFGDRLDWLDAVRRLDLDLRGVRPGPGLDGVSAHIDAHDREGGRPALLPWWETVSALLAPLEAGFAREMQLPALVAALREVAQSLAPDGLWRGLAGRSLGDCIAALERHGDALAGFAPLDAPALIAAFLSDVAVRPVGRHPRLAIWGLIEARLQRADLMILGGLNDGVWPPRAPPDPWLAPALRRQLGLPGADAEIGLAAHDFVAGLGAPQVLLTRSRRDDGGPAVASRLWLRLHALAGDALVADAALAGWAHDIDDAGAPQPAARPAPAPPASERPRSLSVTAVDKLRADPFSFYAQAMLKLSVLDPLDADPTGAERGIAVHSILENWVRSGDADPPLLHRFAEAELLKWADHPLMRALWSPRVRRAMDWVLETMRDWEAEGWTPLKPEAKGSYDFAFAHGAMIKLRGIADRIDRNDDGVLAIIDYKTGTVPTHAQVAGGFALQMGLLGVLAQHGVLDGVPSAPVAALRYWKLGGGKDPGKASNPLEYNRKQVMTAPDHVDQANATFRTLCEDYLLGTEPFTAKLHPDHAEKYRDYDHLARVAEWLGKPGSAA
jgi:ATP-dependent helicase/nuclease subunit B